MSAKKKSAKSGKVSTAAPREIVSTCQISTCCGTPVTWTAFRQVGAPAGTRPQCYLCTLPDNTDDNTPSEYNLNAIAAQAKRFPIALRALDCDVVYFVSEPGGAPQRVPVARGETFLVPARGSGSQVIKATLTFDAYACTIEAIPQPPTTIRTLADDESAPVVPMDVEDEPPPPLPSDDQVVA